MPSHRPSPRAPATFNLYRRARGLQKLVKRRRARKSIGQINAIGHRATGSRPIIDTVPAVFLIPKALIAPAIAPRLQGDRPAPVIRVV